MAPSKRDTRDVEDEPVEEPPVPPSLDGRPELLGRRELQLAMDALRRRFSGCKGIENLSGNLQVKLRIARSGAVESVSILPPHEPTPTDNCIRQVARSGSFPRFRGTRIPVIELTYPVPL
jgi:hypothetical protein